MSSLQLISLFVTALSEFCTPGKDVDIFVRDTLNGLSGMVGPINMV